MTTAPLTDEDICILLMRNVRGLKFFRQSYANARDALLMAELARKPGDVRARAFADQWEVV